MEFVVVIEKPTFFVLDTFSARSGELQHDRVPRAECTAPEENTQRTLASLVHWTHRQN